MPSLKRLDSHDFYQRDALSLAEAVLGKVIVHRLDDGHELVARIVECEAYAGEIDKASHTYGGRRTARTEFLYRRAGHIYVYLIYGLHELLNIVAGDESGEGVMIRAVEPIQGLDRMGQLRFAKNYADLSPYQKKNLSNGPGKLTRALGIDLSQNGLDLLADESPLILCSDGYRDFETVRGKRIGIDYAEEAIHFPYRFYIAGNPHVSKV